MRTALYIIWFLLAGFFFAVALWSYLERFSNRQRKDNPADTLRQGFFVLSCVLISIFIDQYLLESITAKYLPDFIPLGLLQVLLLPAILYLGALILGPSKDILISKAPRPSSIQERKKTRRR